MAILTVLSHAELTLLVAAYDLGSLRQHRGLEAGTVNTSYLLELDAGRYFLRIYEEQDARGASREAGVLRHLAAHGVKTPSPVVGKDGAATRAIAGKPAALFPWIDGEIVCQGRVTPRHGEVVGAALAQIHLAGHAPDTVLDAGRFGPRDLAVRCTRVAESRDAEAAQLAGALRDAVLREADRRDRDARTIPMGLIHGDLFRDNVLWQDVNACKLSALLDFESAHDGPFAYDLAVTILSWSYGSSLDMTLAASIVRGYRSVRELEEGDRACLYDESILAALRFTITRITDDAIRVGKRWQRFVSRRLEIEAMGPKRFLEALGL